MAWQDECTRAYLEDRLASFYATLGQPDELGCLKADKATRCDGTAQIKLRWVLHGKAKQAAPRPWCVDSFLKGIDIPVGYDSSHLCGQGMSGCVNPDHIIVEPHAINLDRRHCHIRTVCPCPCGMEHPLRPCFHQPRCIQIQARKIQGEIP